MPGWNLDSPAWLPVRSVQYSRLSVPQSGLPELHPALNIFLSFHRLFLVFPVRLRTTEDNNHQEHQRKKKSSFPQTPSWCFLAFSMDDTRREWQYLYSLETHWRRSCREHVRPTEDSDGPYLHTLEPFPSPQCQLGSSASDPSENDLVTYNHVEKVFWWWVFESR